MRTLLIFLMLVNFTFGQVTITDKEIITPHDTIPRFGGKVITENTVWDQPRTEGFIEIAEGVTLTVSSQLTFNTLIGMPRSTLLLKEGAELIIEGPIPDDQKGQFGRSIISLGLIKSEATPFETWNTNHEYFPNNYKIIIRGVDRGHTMVVGEGSYDLRYVRFINMGRTRIEELEPIINQVGRYPIHAHQVKSGGTVIGCLVEEYLKWGIAIHNTSSWLVEDNVVIGNGIEASNNGAGIVTELGTETNCIFKHNLVKNSYGLPRNPNKIRLAFNDEGFEGNGYWFKGITDNEIINNVAIDCFIGFHNFTIGEGLSSIFTDNLGRVFNKNQRKPRLWKDNISIGCDHGMFTWNPPTLVTFENQKCINNKLVGVTCFNGAPHIFKNLEVDGSDFGVKGEGYAGDFHILGNSELKNCRQFGMQLPAWSIFEGTLEGNRIDFDADGGHIIRTNNLPSVRYSNTVPNFPQQNISLIELSNKKVVVFNPRVKFNEPSVFSLFSGMTNGQVWDKYKLASGNFPLLPSYTVYNNSSISNRSNILMDLVDFNSVPTFPSGTPILALYSLVSPAPWSIGYWEVGDIVKLYGDGTQRATRVLETNPLTPYRINAAGYRRFWDQDLTRYNEVIMEVVRNGVVVSRLVVGEPPLPPNPDLDALLKELADLEEQLGLFNIEKTNLENSLNSINKQITQTESRIQEVKDLINQISK